MEDVFLTEKQESRLNVIRTLVGQQQYLYDNKVHSVPDRIVSISQPYIRPIVRGKAKAPVEFGAKLDLSIDEKGMARLERLSFDAYNESDVLILAIEGYYKRTGQIGITAHHMISEFQVRHWDARKRMLKSIKNRNTGIIQTESK